jgi:hypothetical protein
MVSGGEAQAKTLMGEIFLPPNILAIQEVGKNMVGKNIFDIHEHVNRRLPRNPPCARGSCLSPVARRS